MRLGGLVSHHQNCIFRYSSYWLMLSACRGPCAGRISASLFPTHVLAKGTKTVPYAKTRDLPFLRYKSSYTKFLFTFLRLKQLAVDGICGLWFWPFGLKA